MRTGCVGTDTSWFFSSSQTEREGTGARAGEFRENSVFFAEFRQFGQSHTQSFGPAKREMSVFETQSLSSSSFIESLNRLKGPFLKGSAYTILSFCFRFCSRLCLTFCIRLTSELESAKRCVPPEKAMPADKHPLIRM